MSQEIQFIIQVSEEDMQKSISHLEKELIKIRAGRANPVMLSNIKLDYYGTLTPISQVGNINTPDAQTLSIQPWDKTILPEIEKAILSANLGFNPMNNGEVIIINVPPLTEERRKELNKVIKIATENAKISVRNIRKSTNDEIKKMEVSKDEKKNYEMDVQSLTDRYVQKIEDIYKAKEKEIMTI